MRKQDDPRQPFNTFLTAIMNAYPENILKRLQDTLLDMLDIVARICEENGIEWFLSDGSALGAIRHGSMIPWDDDIDISMLRPDYERFLQVATRELPDGYTLQTPRLMHNYAPMFAKICKTGTKFITQENLDAGLDQGITLDIFPLDPVSANASTRNAQYRHARRCTRMSYLYHSRHVSVSFTGIVKPLSKAAFAAAHVILKAATNEDRLREKFDKGTRIPESEPNCGYTAFGYPYVEPLPKETLVPASFVDFCGKPRPVPRQSEVYLAALYGNGWSELPPPEKRKTHAPLILDFGDGVNVLA